ncbi:MAG TPA: putative ABC exporter domain-containing protein [Gemmatimonadaceae bacterium]|nr:putative ABC exporter domain-containing protein [Gemmatimonadaceae bacterium]
MSEPRAVPPERTGALAALGFLVARSGRNRLRVQLARLKNVRYVLGLLFLVLYFGSIFRRGMFGRVPRNAQAEALVGPNLLAIMAFGLTILVAYWWTFGSKVTPLALSRAEARQLLPAPLSRVQLVLFKLARSHLAVLLSAIILAFVSRRASNVLPFPLRIASYFVMFGTFQLHQLGATLTRTGGRPIGERLGRRAWVIGGVVVALIVAAVALSVAPLWPSIVSAPDPGTAMDRMREALYSYPALLIIAPARAVVAPLSASSVSAWTLSFPIALAIWLVHIPWILINRTPFEEAAVAAGERREAMRAAMRAQRASGGRGLGAMIAARSAAGKKTYVARRTWLRLAPTGRPWVAIVWKNFIPTIRQMRWATLLLFLLGATLIGGVSAWGRYNDTGDLPGAIVFGRNLLASIALFLAVIWTLLGPIYTRNDFRSDLPYLRLLRTYPLDSGALVGAQIASSAGLIYLFQALLLVVALLLPAGEKVPGFAERLLMFATLLVALGTLDVLSVTVRNAVALFFPGWVRLGGEGGGFEAIGQNLLGTAGSLLLLVVLLIAPALLAGGVLYSLGTLPRDVNGYVLLALVVFIGAIVAELWFLFRWLGSVYDNIDAGEILEPA